MRFCGSCGAALTQPCGDCGFESPPGFAFCGQCGTALAGANKALPSAAATSQNWAAPERSPRDYTPRHLADRILRQRDVLEGERKRVTVLFVDVKGSMELAEQMDSEQWHQILDGFFRILSEGIHRYEGTVNQYTGDGVMALFGAPLAHEDHAQRACFAALHLRIAIDEYADELRRQGHGFAVRMGLNSGEVVVGRIGDDLRMDYTAQGHTVGLAARVQNLAAPGRACLSGETAALVEGYFRLRDLGPARIKGVSEPVDLFELEDVSETRTRLDRSKARGFSRFVGRADEMDMLEHALNRADAGERQIVGVVGEAGIGKSRLCAEFVDRARARGVPVYEAHCPSHGKSLSGVGSRELILSFFGVSEHDAPDEARRKIAGTLVLLDPSFEEMLPLVFDACGVADPERPAPALDPAARRQRTVAFLRELIQARSARSCALFLLDDLHWADPETDVFISQVVETAASTRTMLLCNFRPEYEATWMDSSDYLRIPLRALTVEDSARLVDSLLGDDPSLAPLRARILERAGGNPFFAEELVQSMVEANAFEGHRGAYRLLADADAIAVPETVHAVLAARIDRLPEREKEFLHAAAVVGREFGAAVLAGVLDRSDDEVAEGLTALRSADFVVEEAVYPELEYAFKHPLTHEVAYRTQLTPRRAALHGDTARELAERGADPALIAQHLEEAGEALAAARRYAEAAGEFAHRDPEPGNRCWAKVRELCAPLSDTEARELHERAISQILLTGWTLGIEAEVAAELHREGMALAQARGDVSAQVVLLGIYSFIRMFHENSLAQVETLEEAARLVPDCNNFAMDMMIQQRLGWAYLMKGDLDRCLEVSDAALARCESDREKAGRLAGYGAQLFILTQRAFAHGFRGHFSEAEEALIEAHRMGVEDDDGLTLSNIQTSRANLSILCGDFVKAEGEARLSLEWAKASGVMLQVVPLFKLGHALARQEKGEALLDLASAFDDFGDFEGPLMDSVPVYRTLGLFFTGRHEEARSEIERVTDIEEARAYYAEIGFAMSPDLIQGWVMILRTFRLVLGGAARARCEAIVTLVQALIDATGITILQPELDLERAELARAGGDEEGWRSLIEGARQVFVADGRERRVAAIDAALGAASRDDAIG